MRIGEVFLFSLTLFVLCNGYHKNIKEKIGAYVKSAEWKPLGWKANMNGSMMLSLLQRFEVPLKGHLNRKGSLFSKSCTDIKSELPNAKDGVYYIYPDGKKSISAYCDMTTDGGGWTVFQNRKDGNVSFYRTWNEYKTGFGKTSGEYWLGNDALHLLTRDGTCTLRVNLETVKGQKAYSIFTNFTISSESDGYRMNYTAYDNTGLGGDALAHHKGMKFSTKDKDNDKSSGNCARSYYGAWWYKNCHHSNLNGLFGKSSNTHMRWYGMMNKNQNAYMRKTKMMIKC